MYAILNAPVSGSPADDVFCILTDEYLYIEYSEEMIKESIYYLDGLGAQSSYDCEQTDNKQKSMSVQVYLYNDIPIDLTDCIVNDPESPTSAEEVKLPENTTGFYNAEMNLYYPEGFKDDPNDMETNCGLTRYRIFFLRPDTPLSFIAQIGDNEISVYSTAEEGEDYVLPTLVRQGSMSDLSWVMKSGDVGVLMLVWIGVIFIILILIMTSVYKAYKKDEAPEPAKKNKSEKKKKNKKRR